MEEIRFRIRGLAQEEVRNWRSLGQSPAHAGQTAIGRRVSPAWKSLSRTTRRLVTAAVVGAAFYAVAAQSSVQDVRGRRVIVVLDVSNSMSNTTEQRDAQLAALKANNISVTEPYPSGGFAISEAAPDLSLLQPLLSAVQENPGADTVYVISDFKYGDETTNDEAGYQELRDTLRQHHLTLYFCTVDQRPPLAEYYDIAEASGGEVIEEYRNMEAGR